MKTTTRCVVTTVALSTLAGAASAQLRVVNWNISNYNGASRATDIQTAVYGVNPANGLSMRPDVIAVQEIIGAPALVTLVNVLNSAPGSPGDWASAPYLDDPNYVDTESSFVYRTTKVQLLASVVVADADGTTSDQPRSTYRYDIRPVGYTSAGASVGIYSVHLKAGSTGTDNARRLIETTRIRDNAEGVNTNGPGTALPAGYNFILAGDLNMQNNMQTSYVELVGSQANNAGRFFDPINTPGSWNNNAAFNFVHTQDPANNGGAGMDDRHDQILISASLTDGQGLSYIGNTAIPYSTTTWNDPNHSYRAWGNDGTCYNTILTTTGNTMVGPVIAQALINAATTAGGHLPVLLDLRVPAKVATDVTTLDFGLVHQGAPAPVRTINVSNAGDVALWNAAGIDALNYSLGTAAGFTIPAGSFSDAAGGGANAHNLTMPTSVVGVKNTTFVITSDDPDQPTKVITLLGTVLPPNQAPTANAGPDQSPTDSDNNGSETVTLSGSLSTDSDGTIVSYLWSEGVTNLAPASASPTLNHSFSVGTHTITLRVTDDDGAQSTDTVVITVNPFVGVSCDPIDYNGDGLFPDTADIDDFLSVFSGGPCSTGTCGDLDFNNDTLFPDTLDIDSLLNVFSGGPCL